MKLMTYCTRSHVSMLEQYLLPSARAAGFEVEIVLGDQHCPTGQCRAAGFGRTVRDKVISLARWTEIETKPFIFADADIIVHGLRPDDVTRELEGCDIAAQVDGKGVLCSGLMMIKPSPAVSGFFAGLMPHITDVRHDQHCMNESLAVSEIVARGLGDDYASAWTITGRHWDGRPLRVRNTVKTFHANWCWGVEAKLKLLKQVKESLCTTWS